MALPLSRKAPRTSRRADDPITYHATLWVDGRFGELSAAAYSVGIARARRMGVVRFLQAMAVSETRKAFIGTMTRTAVGIVERKVRMSSPSDTDRPALLQKADQILRLRMGTIAVIAATLAGKLGLSLESEFEGGTAPTPGFDRTLAELEGETAWGAPIQPPPDHVRPAPAQARPAFPKPRPAAAHGRSERRDQPAPRSTDPAGGTAKAGPPEPSLQVWRPRNERPGDAVEQLRRAMAILDGKRRQAATREFEGESGWNIALRRSAGGPQPSPQHVGAARQRIRAAAAPAFAAALDKAVDATLLQQFAARHPGGVDAAKLRATYAETANRAFAAEFVRLVGGQPPASAEDIALGAIIAVSIAQTSARYPIVSPAAVAPMAVLVHRTLRPRLAELARMAAVIAAAPGTPPARPRPRSAAPGQPAREMAW